MDEREARKVQREASEALLDLGVSLPLKEWQQIGRASCRERV